MFCQRQFTQVFSYSTLNDYKKRIAASPNPPTLSVCLPNLRHPQQLQLVIGTRPIKGSAYCVGIVRCTDIQTLVAVRTRVLSDVMASFLLLIHCYSDGPIPAQPILLRITVDLASFAHCDPLSRHIAWARRMWILMARAHLVSFTGVYFSVLGGAYCSLGKTNTVYARKAKALAAQQIRLARWLKDPILESKCWLYYAEDLIQLGQLKRATKIIHIQTAYATRCHDTILLKMCESVILKKTAKETLQSELR